VDSNRKTTGSGIDTGRPDDGSRRRELGLSVVFAVLVILAAITAHYVLWAALTLGVLALGVLVVRLRAAWRRGKTKSIANRQ
jgi:hypothetical protein